ncbi:RNA polymerase subunit sigma [Streptomyces sp. WAC 01529]|uniref:anti-sigma factor family protein n=1 Tax=Streptomyces sp. WAC 01529 TaxID=2203205 RepID=UPI000F6C8EB7|nr:zf-HC2 domain-containing protein [Streptomyces sp. WAC 01529]AZM53537.1 RNA polymerase subunit sigma [Streptomyces sp. WAC 01529]
MTGFYGHHDEWQDDTIHETVGAYALGVLDEAENARFEAHLAVCEICARQLEEFSGVEPMLAALADLPGGHGVPAIGEQLAARPGPHLAQRLAGEVSRTRERRRRRGLYLVAAAVALIVGGPLTVLAVTGDDAGSTDIAAHPHPTSPAEDAFFHHMEEKSEATDPATKVSATVGTEKKTWGTHAVLELKNVKGPLKCSLVAVGKDGRKETVTTWSVPKWGYGIKDSPNKWARSPLYVHGGAAMDRNDIDHFEVTTFDGDRLVEVDV